MFCRNCGAEVSEEARFCLNCGHSVVDYRAPPPPRESIGFAKGTKEAFLSLFKTSEAVGTPHKIAFDKPHAGQYSSIQKYGVAALGLIVAVVVLDLIYGVGLQAVALVVPVVYMIWVTRTDRYEPEPKSLILVMFGWGMISTVPSLFANNTFFALVSDDYISATIGAPIIEETFKMLGLLWLVNSKKFRGQFNDHMDGLVYGFAVGMGFSVIEDAFYFYSVFATDGIGAVTGLFITRQLLFGIGHGVFTAMTGRWLGLVRVRVGRVRKRDVLPGLVVAIFLHGLWNGTTIIPLMGFILTLWFAVFLRRHIREALQDETSWGLSAGPSTV
jgi:RsiW-degrading membrane proteinase PrsW (M82 family)